MNHCFDVSRRHLITESNKNLYITPAMHPTRRMAEHDFIYMVEGTWKIGQESETYLLRKDDVLILQAGLDHYGISPCSAGCRTMYIHAMALPSDNAADTPFYLESHISAAANPAVKKCFERTIYAMATSDPSMAAVYFDVLLFELKSLMQLSNKTSIADGIRQAILSSDRFLSNEELARAQHIGIKTAERAFKNEYGKTIHQYQLEAKVDSAKAYLTHFPNMRLSEIAANLGFYDEFHFSKQFKSVTGLSPREYRAKRDSF